MYLRDVDANDPPAYAAPGLVEDLAGLVPAYVETAEFDPSRDEGLVYADRLEAASVDVERNPTRGTIHGFDMCRTTPRPFVPSTNVWPI